MKGQIQFRITFILAITAMVCATLALLRHFSPYILLPALAIPFAYATEFLATGTAAMARIPRSSHLGRLSIVVALSAILAGFSFLSLTAGYPTVLRPLPLLPTILAIYGLSLELIVGVPAIAFIVTIAPEVWIQRERLPVRFWSLLIAGTLGSVHWLATGWPYAIQYQSRGYAIGVVAVNLGFLMVLWLLAWILRHSRSFTTTLGFATILFVWLFAAAFPWMGELP